MLCFNLKSYNRTCGGVSGGISDLVIFDPDDFDFTQAAAVSGAASPYSAITLRSGSGVAGTATVGGGAVTGVTITSGGTNYNTPPTVAFTGGGGTGATGHATIAGGVVTGVVIDTPGTGYTGAPNVVFTGGGAVAASGAKMFVINFLPEEADWTVQQSTKACSSKYEHTFNFTLPENSQNLTTFQQALDAASCCCGIGIIMRMNNNRIFVAGEKHVNGVSITRFRIKHDGSKGGSGKLIDDANTMDIVLKGAYVRSLYEYSGTWADIEALQ